jgi:hypothetical protein
VQPEPWLRDLITNNNNNNNISCIYIYIYIYVYIYVYIGCPRMCSKEFFRLNYILWNPKFHKSSESTCPCPEQDSFTQRHTIFYFRNNFNNSIHARFVQVVSVIWLYHQNSVHILFLAVRATSPSRLSLLYFITERIFGEAFKPRSYSSSNCFNSPVTSTVLCQNTFPSTLFSNTLSHYSSSKLNGQSFKYILPY